MAKIFEQTKDKKQSPQIQFLIEQYRGLIKETKAKGIQIIFVNSTPNIYTTKRRKIIFDNLPTDSKINMEDPYNLPEFYQYQYFYDTHHLNSKGAELYSQKLTQLFTKLHIHK